MNIYLKGFYFFLQSFNFLLNLCSAYTLFYRCGYEVMPFLKGRMYMNIFLYIMIKGSKLRELALGRAKGRPHRTTLTPAPYPSLASQLSVSCTSLIMPPAQTPLCVLHRGKATEAGFYELFKYNDAHDVQKYLLFS